jgi:tetratricopeptide (TPR) repeat protein
MIERAQNDPGAEAQHAAGVAMVLVDKPAEAAARLDAAARTSHDARLWNDLAAARYQTATRSRRTSDYGRALAAADQALRIDARFPEALFNRALILERMESTADARLAWQRYLDVDATSRWASEARQRLAALTSPAPADRSTRGGTSRN